MASARSGPIPWFARWAKFCSTQTNFIPVHKRYYFLKFCTTAKFVRDLISERTKAGLLTRWLRV